MINSATPIGRRLLARKSWTCRPVNQAKDELKAMLEEIQGVDKHDLTLFQDVGKALGL